MGALSYRYLYILLLSAVFSAVQYQPGLAEESPLDQARRAFGQGSYAEALQLYESVDRSDKDAALLGTIPILVMTGNYGKAEETCRQLLERFAGNEQLQFRLAEILLLTGRSDQALKLLQATADRPAPSVQILVQFGEILRLRGRNSQAEAYFERAVSQFDQGLVFGGRQVAYTALAAKFLGRYQEANQLFRQAARIDPDNLEIQVLWGDLFLEKYNRAEAQRSYSQALKQNSRHVPALVGMARLTRGAGAFDFLDAAFQVNPRSVPALVTRADLLIADDRFDEAGSTLAQALVVNPESIEALTLKGAIAYLQGDQDAFQTIEKQVATLSPQNAWFYAHIAEICGRTYLFDEAVQMALKAVSMDQRSWYGHTMLGMNLLRLGREDTGRSHLEKGFEGDPFNVWAMNMLNVLDVLDGFQTRRTEQFIVRMHPADADALWPYLDPLLKEAWQSLTAKYDFKPRTPVLIEIFHDHQDFAVRTSGLPEIGHLLGVCFGDVITLTSPRAYPSPDAINWQEVVWHEFAHVITLQMTDNRIPRWLSEGVSVYEEASGRPEWGRRQDLDLVKAVEENRIIPLGELDEAFSRAKTLADVNFAYYQSYLVVDHIVSRYGFETLKKLIYQHGVNADQDTIFKNVFELPPDEFEKHFLAWIDQRIAEINIHIAGEQPDPTNPFSKTPSEGDAPAAPGQDGIDELRKRIEAHPRDFMAHYQLGLMLYRAKELDAAIGHLTAARDLLPGYSASPGPRRVLADIYEQLGDKQAMRQELEELVKIDQDAFDACVKLARAARESQQFERAVYYLERAIAVNPYDLDVHRSLAEIFMQRADYKRAVREYGVLLALDDTDPALANTNLADALLRAGERDRARRHALAALEIAPMFERAQRILLAAIAP